MQTLNDDSPMPFGKYKGIPMSDVPVAYLHWLWTDAKFKTQTKTSNVAAYIAENLDALKGEDDDLIWS